MLNAAGAPVVEAAPTNRTQWGPADERLTSRQPLALHRGSDGVPRRRRPDHGPPYAVNWVDDNPFEPHEITVEASLPTGDIVRGAIKLPAFEFLETAEVASILVDAAIYDAAGRVLTEKNPLNQTTTHTTAGACRCGRTT